MIRAQSSWTTGLLSLITAFAIAACTPQRAGGPAKNSDPNAPGVQPTGPGGNGLPAPPPPDRVDTNGHSVPNTGNGVTTLACAQQSDRPFSVFDAPGADSALLVDARVNMHSTLRTTDNKDPGLAVIDPELDVVAILVGMTPDPGVTAPQFQRDAEQHRVLEALGQVTAPTTRTFTTPQGYVADQASYAVVLNQPSDAGGLASMIATSLLGGTQLTGLPSSVGKMGMNATINVLNIWRSSTSVVVVAAVAVGAPASDDQIARIEELTDGTNVARHGSFTRHVCDPFSAQGSGKADILWVVDDSCSMQDDQMQVRNAGQAMADVLTNASVDYRLGVARMYAEAMTDPNRGQLVAPGMTSDLKTFQDIIVVGAVGGWEYGLQVGLLAIDGMTPKTPASMPADPYKLRDDATLIVAVLSDERDQNVQDAACGGIMAHEGDQVMCDSPSGRAVTAHFIDAYQKRNAVMFAIVSDEPGACAVPGSTLLHKEPGQGYIEVANATGGKFGSICGDMHQNVTDIARVATGASSSYHLTEMPASASIKVAMQHGSTAVVITRNRTNGWDYDPASNNVIFYGDARPQPGDQIVVGYRRWDWAGNTTRPQPSGYAMPAPSGGSPTGTTMPFPNGGAPTGSAMGVPNGGAPPDACDLCRAGTSCDPTLDVAYCETPCGDAVCNPAQVCLPESGVCGPAGGAPPMMSPQPAGTSCSAGCGNGTVCNPTTMVCVAFCEQSGCGTGQMCNTSTHLCETRNL
jgi:hypothetical protein